MTTVTHFPSLIANRTSGSQMSADRFHRVARAASVVAILLGSTGMLGWVFDVAVLKSVLPGLATMKMNTALSLGLAGVSLVLQIEPTSPPRTRWIGRACALLVAAVAVLTLLEHALGVDVGIDQLLIRAPAGEFDTSGPGRMAPNTAFCFAFAGTALFLLDARTGGFNSAPWALALAVLLVGFVGVTGFALSVTAAHGVLGAVSMAIHTAVGLVALSIGILAARPQRGVIAILAQDSAGGVAIRRLLPLIVVIPLVVAWVGLKGHQAGFYGTEVGLALVVTVCTSTIASIAFWNARVQGISDGVRQQALQDERLLFELGELLRVSKASEVLSQASKALGEYLGVSRCAFIDIDITSDRATIHRDHCNGPQSLAGMLERPSFPYSSESLAELTAGRTVVTSDTSADERTAQQYEKVYRPAGIGAWVNVPLLRGGQYESALVASTHEPRAWQPREITLIQSVAERTWTWSEHLRALEALRQSEIDLLVTMNSIGDALIATDIAGRTVRMNPVAERLTGWKASEAATEPLHEVFRILDEETRTPAESPVERVLREGKVVGLAEHAILVARDGSERAIANSGAPIRDSEGTIRGVVLVFRDASVERAAQRALRQSEARKTAVLDSAFDAIVSMDHQGLVVEFNAAAETIFRYRRDQAIGNAMAELLIPPLHTNAYQRGLAQSFGTEEGFVRGRVMEISAMRGDGSVFPAEIVITRVQGQEPPLFTAFFRDITERKRASESEERFRLFVHAVKDYAIFLLNPDGTVATWNAGAERLNGYRAEEIVGQPVSTIYGLEDVEAGKPKEDLEIAVRDGTYEDEAWRVRKDGSRLWTHVVISALRNTKGELVGFGKVTRDMTELRRAEREREDLLGELKELNTALEQRVEDRTAALTATLQEREVLLQEIHHRVKNNLSVVVSLMAMQARLLEQGEGRHALEECQGRVHAIALIHEKLYHSKNYADVPFADYLRGLAGDVFHATGVSPSTVSLAFAVDDVAMTVEKAIPCGLILNELITNALKHGYPSGRRGTIRVEFGRADDGQLRLTVADDGVGLPPGLNIQETNSLGLRLVVTLAKQLDGELTVDTDRGTVIQVTFPMERAET